VKFIPRPTKWKGSEVNYWVKKILTDDFSRNRAWLRFISDIAPPNIQKVVQIALETSHWPDEIALCSICRFPTMVGRAICEACEEEQQDYEDQQELYNDVR
jgi:hypothetical protein